jgi:hypothetical protein
MAVPGKSPGPVGPVFPVLPIATLVGVLGAGSATAFVVVVAPDAREPLGTGATPSAVEPSRVPGATRCAATEIAGWCTASCPSRPKRGRATSMTPAASEGSHVVRVFIHGSAHWASQRSAAANVAAAVPTAAARVQQ